MMSVLEQKMADETKDGELKDDLTKDEGSTPTTPSQTLELLRGMADKMRGAQQKVADAGTEYAKDLTFEQREEVLKRVLDRFDPHKDSPETKEMFDAMKRLEALRGMMRTAEERMNQERDEQAKDFTPEERESRMREMLQRFEADLVPKLPDEKSRTKAMVIIVVLDISERQILQGRPCDEDWVRLKKILSHREDALRVVTDLEAAIGRYDSDLQKAVTQGEADEAQMRKAHHGIIQQVLVAKLKTLISPRPAQAAPKAIEPGEGKTTDPGESKS
jgi:hypothetical protein